MRQEFNCAGFLWILQGVWYICGILFGVFAVFCLVFLWQFVWCFLKSWLLLLGKDVLLPRRKFCSATLNVRSASPNLHSTSSNVYSTSLNRHFTEG